MTDFAFPFPALVCDTGGTNVRFALVSEPGGRLSDIVHLRTGDYPGLAEAIEAAVPKLGARPRSIDRLRRGAGRRADAQAHQRALGDGWPGSRAPHRPAQGLLLNDFEAQALSLPTIPEGWERRIGPLKFGPEGPQVILGPGTGLGVAALVEADGRFTPVSSEACHIDFGPVSAGGIRDLAASRTRARAHHERERHFRRGARARPPRAHDGERRARSARRAAGRHRSRRG